MRKMWKKAAITAMVGTMMMTGCALEGGIDLGHRKPAETLSTSKVANSSDASQASSAIPNTSVKVEIETPSAEEPTVTGSAAPESTASESTAPEATAESSTAANSTIQSPSQSSTQDSSTAANSTIQNPSQSSTQHSSTAANTTLNPSQNSTQESISTTAWYQVTGEVAEGDGDVSWFTMDVITEDNFWVTFHGAVNDEEISNVKIAVWTEANGQDDIEYIDAESIGNETKSCPVYISNHNNEKSGYILTVSYINRAGEEKTYQHYTPVSVE